MELVEKVRILADTVREVDGYVEYEIGGQKYICCEGDSLVYGPYEYVYHAVRSTIYSGVSDSDVDIFVNSKYIGRCVNDTNKLIGYTSRNYGVIRSGMGTARLNIMKNMWITLMEKWNYESLNYERVRIDVLGCDVISEYEGIYNITDNRWEVRIGNKKCKRLDCGIIQSGVYMSKCSLYRWENGRYRKVGRIPEQLKVANVVEVLSADIIVISKLNDPNLMVVDIRDGIKSILPDNIKVCKVEKCDDKLMCTYKKDGTYKLLKVHIDGRIEYMVDI